MSNIRITAAATAILAALTFTLAPASAGPCDTGEGACAETKAGAPLRLGQFMKHKRAAAATTTHHDAQKKPIAAKSAPASDVPATAQPSDATVEPRADVALAAEPDAGPVKTIETDGIAVTSPGELNEIDAAAGTVRVVAADEVNEIDLAADTVPPAPLYETVGAKSMAAADLPGNDISWIGKLLLAFTGTIAAAGIVRFLVA